MSAKPFAIRLAFEECTRLKRAAGNSDLPH